MRRERETVARVSNKYKKRSTYVSRVYPRVSSIQSQPLELSFKLSLVIEGIVVELGGIHRIVRIASYSP